ncbi:RNA-binding protein NOB1 isoform X1 [Paramormyrops kingsleyae]|uniref:RNA-binding protein NOB1 isoform X1 n=1 Tax=Paramormyrops kingsleyae TaxID=1676925 RepID=UPI003B9706CB
MSATMVEHVVADAGAFLKKAPLQDIGKNIYTLKDVVEEIRDKQTRRNLAFLPYKLNFKEPFPEYIRLVTEFSKKTGDYPSLSATDIKVLALTYQLETETVGSAHLKKDPDVKITLCGTQRHPEAPVDIAGFHLPSKAILGKPTAPPQSVQDTESAEFNSFQFWRNPLPAIESDLLDLLGQDLQPQSEAENAEEVGGFKEGNELDDEEEEDDDGGGWITPHNIKQVQMDMGVFESPTDIRVGCVTTDFSMQNVLIQIGLHVLSVNGMLIRQTRNYILRCHACFKTTTNMTKIFCPNCGNKTLKKVAVTINEDSSMQMHFSKNPKVLNPRGLKHSLALPKGGKHSSNPHLVEDQRFPQQRLSRKARQKTDVFDPDYVASGSPFAENDIYSRAANLQLRDSQCGGGRRRANPNAARKKFVRNK